MRGSGRRLVQGGWPIYWKGVVWAVGVVVGGWGGVAVGGVEFMWWVVCVGWLVVRVVSVVWLVA